MAETVFAGKQVETFSYKQAPGLLTHFNAIITWFQENILMGYRPGNTGHRQGEDEEPYELGGEHSINIKK